MMRFLSTSFRGGERDRPLSLKATPELPHEPMPTLDFWFDFASTYSYPAAMRIGPLAAAAGVAVRYRPFLLGPIFKAQGWDTSPFNVYEAKGRHMWRDLERLCADSRCRSGARSRSRSRACWRRGSRWSGSATAGARISAARCSAPNSPRAADRRRGGDRRHPDGSEARSGRGARRRANRRRNKAAAAPADRRGATARHLRRADLRHRATASCSGATTGWNARCNGRGRDASTRYRMPQQLSRDLADTGFEILPAYAAISAASRRPHALGPPGHYTARIKRQVAARQDCRWPVVVGDGAIEQRRWR